MWKLDRRTSPPQRDHQIFLDHTTVVNVVPTNIKNPNGCPVIYICMINSIANRDVPGTDPNINTVINIIFIEFGDAANIPYRCSIFLVWYRFVMISTIIN